MNPYFPKLGNLFGSCDSRAATMKTSKNRILNFRSLVIFATPVSEILEHQVGLPAGREEEFGAFGSITLAEGFICDDPSGKYEICYRLSCIFFDGAETGAEECISLRLTELKVEIDPDVQDRNSDGSPRFAKEPTVLDRESRDVVLSVNDADAAAAIIKGHFMSRLANRNKRKGKGRMNDFEADLKAFQRIQNITKNIPRNSHRRHL